MQMLEKRLWVQDNAGIFALTLADTRVALEVTWETVDPSDGEPKLIKTHELFHLEPLEALQLAHLLTEGALGIMDHQKNQTPSELVSGGGR